MSVDATVWPGEGPDLCTLPTAERPLRLAEFDDVFIRTVGQVRLSPLHLRLALAGGPELAAAVRELAARETECCSFFAFAVGTQGPDRVVFDIEVPPAQVAVLDALAERSGRAAS
jgi:hypothetical protein